MGYEAPGAAWFGRRDHHDTLVYENAYGAASLTKSMSIVRECRHGAQRGGQTLFLRS